jgi:arylsulfatase A-like enzyme
MSALPRFVIFVFDALRRDMITAQDMPNLRYFIDQGCDFPDSRCVFPSETRVNAASLACGATPSATGVVANKFFDARVFPDRLFYTGKHDDMQAAERAYGGGFVTSPTLGELLADAGRTLAVVSTGSAGATHLLNPRSGRLNQVTLSLSDWRRSTPAAYAKEILAKHGPIPPGAKPNIDRIRLQMDMVLDSVLCDIEPDGLIVWFSDPDSTYHDCGIGSPESVAAIRHTDAQFGRFLDLWRAHPEHDQCTIIVCSDHAQVSAQRRIKVKDALAASGLAVGDALNAMTPLAGSMEYSGSIRAAAGDARHIAALADWLNAQPWCGHVFTPHGDGVRGSVPGTLDRALLLLDHDRAPEVYYTMRADDLPNQWGLPGACWYDSNEVPLGGGTHGGLHRIELNNLLALQGSRYKRGYRSAWPAGIIDIAPTLLSELGMPQPVQMTGRVLGEAFEQRAEPPAVETRIARSESARTAQCLRLWRVGSTAYIDQGWIEGEGAP